MKTYKINEIFYSIQGEGHWAGSPAVFVRFAGCNLNCSWCDTDHSPQRELTAEEIESEIQDAMPDVSVDSLEHIVVVLTGGEPLLQVDTELLDALFPLDIHLETNGTIPLPSTEYFSWITVSPKHDHPVVIPKELIGEMKVVLDGVINPEEHYWAHYYDFIQPCWPAYHEYSQEKFLGNRPRADYERRKLEHKAMMAAVTYVKEHPGWRLSLQLHKVLGIK